MSGAQAQYRALADAFLTTEPGCQGDDRFILDDQPADSLAYICDRCPLPAARAVPGVRRGGTTRRRHLGRTSLEAQLHEEGKPMTEICARCAGPIDRAVRPRSGYCSDRCRNTARDSRPERRAADNARHRARYASDAEYRAVMSEKYRARYAADPEFRAARIARATERYRRARDARRDQGGTP